MHCPNCGTLANNGQKFCRACGLSLERFAQLLVELLPATPETTDAEATRLKQRWQQMNRLKDWGVKFYLALAALFLTPFFLLALAALILTSLFLGIGINKILEDHPSEGLLLVGIWAVGLIVLFTHYYYSSRKQITASRLSQPASLPSGETTNRLLAEPPAQVATSVTEPTTALLEESVKKPV